MANQHELEPYLSRLGVLPEDKPAFVREVYAVDDINTLRQLLIDKERDRQSLSNDLDMAARLGLVISETNEAMQLKLSHLENENQRLQEELHLQQTSCASNNSDAERNHLTQELGQARRELSKFRKEMDGLSAQLNDMASEMVDSRARVSMYAKRLAEVEHKLSTTREMNGSLKLLLDKALTSQKQSSSTTSHLVKNIQMDLSRVVAENDQLRARVAELEQQQLECEERLTTMVSQAKEYASLLEQAQDTIHSLSEPRPIDDDTLSNGLSAVSVSSSSGWDGGVKESEITKGPVFSDEFRQEMQKEIERNLTLRNEIRHRISTAESLSFDKKKAHGGLKYLLADYDSNLATSTSSPTFSKKGDTDDEALEPTEQVSVQQMPVGSPSSMASAITTLRPANFLTGFGGFGTATDKGIGLGLIARGIPNRPFVPSRNNGEPSLSTRFFQRLASRLEEKSAGGRSTPL